MKLSVICSESCKDYLPPLRLVLDEFFIEHKALLIGKEQGMEEFVPALEQTLFSPSFLLLIPSKEDQHSLWFSYVLGMFHDSKEEVMILAPPEEEAVWSFSWKSLASLEALGEFIEKNLPRWQEQTGRYMALQNLEELMKESRHQDFVQAVVEGNRFMTGIFLEAGFDVNKPSAENMSLLGAASRKGHFEIVKILLEAGAALDGVSEDRGHTPLMDAAAEGHQDILELFIREGAELDFQNKSGQSALVLATGNKHYDCAGILLDAGADCEQSDSMGLSARKYAELYKLESLLKKMPPRE